MSWEKMVVKDCSVCERKTLQDRFMKPDGAYYWECTECTNERAVTQEILPVVTEAVTPEQNSEAADEFLDPT